MQQQYGGSPAAGGFPPPGMNAQGQTIPGANAGGVSNPGMIPGMAIMPGSNLGMAGMQGMNTGMTGIPGMAGMQGMNGMPGMMPGMIPGMMPGMMPGMTGMPGMMPGMMIPGMMMNPGMTVAAAAATKPESGEHIIQATKAEATVAVATGPRLHKIGNAKSGVLLMKGDPRRKRHNWKPKQVTLADGRILITGTKKTSKKEKAPLSIHLHDECSISTSLDSHTQSYAFGLSTGSEHYEFAGDSDSNRESWIDVIESWIGNPVEKKKAELFRVKKECLQRQEAGDVAGAKAMLPTIRALTKEIERIEEARQSLLH